MAELSFEVVTVDEQGREIARREGTAQSFVEQLPGGVGLEMVAIPGGNFRRGNEGSAQHEVTVPPFFVGRYTVTQAQWKAFTSLGQRELQAQWKAFMSTEQRELEISPQGFKGEDRPVGQVCWLDAQEFCFQLSQLTGRKYRLPSEAEWEYACRAGTTTPFHFGETLTTDLANYNGSYTFAKENKGIDRKGTTPVGSFLPNGFGLYDMHGNVWEWCEDHYHSDLSEAPNDGSAWVDENAANDAYRVFRGGSWLDYPGTCRSAFRTGYNPAYRNNFTGFRVVCCAPRPQS